MSKINSVSDINFNLEEGRLLYAAMSLLRDFLIQEYGEENSDKVTPDGVLDGVKKRVPELFPDMKTVRSILSETGEPIKSN